MEYIIGQILIKNEDRFSLRNERKGNQFYKLDSWNEYNRFSICKKEAYCQEDFEDRILVHPIDFNGIIREDLIWSPFYSDFYVFPDYEELFNLLEKIYEKR